MHCVSTNKKTRTKYDTSFFIIVKTIRFIFYSILLALVHLVQFLL